MYIKMSRDLIECRAKTIEMSMSQITIESTENP